MGKTSGWRVIRILIYLCESGLSGMREIKVGVFVVVIEVVKVAVVAVPVGVGSSVLNL